MTIIFWLTLFSFTTLFLVRSFKASKLFTLVYGGVESITTPCT